MITTLVMPDSIATSLRDFARLKVETGGVLLAREAWTPSNDLRLLAAEFWPVPDHAYVRREADELLITSDGYVPALARAEILGAVPIWLHTHPGGDSSSSPSEHDCKVDEQLGDLFRLRSGSRWYGAVILSQEGDQLRFTGTLNDGKTVVEIDRLLTVGPRINLRWNERADRLPLSHILNRNVAAFGGEVQRIVQDLKLAVVGCGGTGSAVAEQLVRLGARHLLLIDPDNIEASNLTRVYGSRTCDVGRLKVDVLADHLRRIAGDAEIATMDTAITSESTAQQLGGSDLVFGCTDDNAGRLVLSRLATFMLIPVIDVGVVISSGVEGRLEGIDGRVTLLYPGAACLVCRGRIDIARAASEMLTPGERRRRVDEGYAPALGGIEPAVVAYTTLISAYAVGELLERLIAYGPEPPPSELIIRIHDREVSVNRQLPHSRHYCDPNSGKIGLGITEPFLEQVWGS